MRNAEDDVAMARRFFGYGRWEAPYWFLGPRQNENAGKAARVPAWVRLGQPEVCDCHQYHCEIAYLKWHTGKPPLEPTWRRLMLFLMASLKTVPLERSRINDDLRNYQRDMWGRVKGETCVIDLCAHAAKGLASSSNCDALGEERIKTIRERIAKHRPKLVLMYGKADDEWARVAGGQLAPETLEKRGSTLFVQTPQPTWTGRTDRDWTSLAESIRQHHGDFLKSS